MGVSVGVSILIILIIAVIIFVTYKKKYRWYPRMSLGFSNAMYRREIDDSYWFEMLPFLNTCILLYYIMSWFYALFIFSLILNDVFVVLYNETKKIFCLYIQYGYFFFNVDFDFIYNSAWFVLLLKILKLTRSRWWHDFVAIVSYLCYVIWFVSAINFVVL